MLDYRWINTVESKDDEKAMAEVLEDDVMTLCINTDFCQQTGLSFTDILQLEFPTYRRLRDRMYAAIADKNKRHASIDREARQQNDRLHSRKS